MGNPVNPWQEIDDETVKGRVLQTLSGVANRVRANGLVVFNGRPVDGETITMTDVNGGEVIYEWDDDGIVLVGTIPVDISASIDVDGDALALYNTVLGQAANTGVQPFQSATGVVQPNLLLVAAGVGAVGTTVVSSGGLVDGYDIDQGGSDMGSPQLIALKHEITAIEVSQGIAHINVPFTPLQTNLSLVDSADAAKAWDGVVTTVPTEARVEALIGASPFAAGDFIVGTIVGGPQPEGAFPRP